MNENQFENYTNDEQNKYNFLTVQLIRKLVRLLIR